MRETARRILHIIKTAVIGGAELVLLRLLERHDRRRYKPSVLSLRPPESLEQEYAALAPLHSLNMRSSVPTPGACTTTTSERPAECSHQLRSKRREVPAQNADWILHDRRT